MENSKGIQVIILLSALAVMFLFVLDLRNDYYFHFTKKETNAIVKNLQKVKGYRPYQLTLSYINDDKGARSECSLKVDGRYGKKLEENATHSIAIAYTKKNVCDIYILDYKHPTIGSFLLHDFLFLFSLLGVVLISKQILRK